jgi:hypothetical protein
MSAVRPLYRLHSKSPRTRYAELKQRACDIGELLRGTPGGVFKRAGTGHEYWYRVYYPVPGKQAEEFIAPAHDKDAQRAMRARIAVAQRMVEQVRKLKQTGYQVADKAVASVLIELHNSGLFKAGLIVVGTLAYMGWLNEHGARTVSVQAQNVDLARGGRLRVKSPISLLKSFARTHVPATPARGGRGTHSITVGLPGKATLRVDVLAPGRALGQIVQIPELEWRAQMMPHYDYLLEDCQEAAVLAGGQCIPVLLPRPERIIWHKIYSSTDGTRLAEKKAKDLAQAVTLAAVIAEQKGDALRRSFAAAPAALRTAVLAQRSRIQALLLPAHPRTSALFASLRR